MKEAYRVQKGNARDRGIKFEFTYAEWVAWWEEQLGPDWAKLRGCKKHQYVMARRGDKGPYHPTNVKCITAKQNHLERNRRLWMSRQKHVDSQNDIIPWYERPIE
jgi:hypothetical protein